MIKASELRIGNIIYQGEQYVEAPITAYQIYQYSLLQAGSTDVSEYYKEWKRIPLTKEWHLKFGATPVSENSFCYTHNEVEFIVRHDKVGGCWVVDYNNIHFKKLVPMPVKLKYLHELQNFIFANTGKELTIKE